MRRVKSVPVANTAATSRPSCNVDAGTGEPDLARIVRNA